MQGGGPARSGYDGRIMAEVLITKKICITFLCCPFLQLCCFCVDFTFFAI